MLTLEDWKTQTDTNLRTLLAKADTLGSASLYGALATCAITPLIAASKAGQVPYADLVDLVGGVGLNLLSNQLQSWHNSTDEALTAELNAKATAEPAWRDLLDTLLDKLEALRVVQTITSEVDKAWLAPTLRTALAEAGSRLDVGGDNLQVGNIDGSVGVAVGRNITQIIHYYQQPEEPVDEAALGEQIHNYLAWVCRRYGTVTLRGMQRQGQQAMELPLDRVYVPLAAQTMARRIELNELLNQGKKIVVTGGPGSGKTTVLQHVAWTLAMALLTDDLALAQEQLGLEPVDKKAGRPIRESVQSELDFVEEELRLPIPIILPLSVFALHRRQARERHAAHERTLAAVIADYLIAQQQGVVDLLPAFFARLLQSGRYLLLLLDGLDEVPNEEERERVRQAIERLADGKRDLQMIVTCRIAAYQGRTALARDFREVRVQPLDAEHITAMVRQAYGALYQEDMILRERQINELLNGVRDLEVERRRRLGDDVPQLIDSPLMIRLLLIVHLNERRFPQHRAELYQRATDNLLWPDYGLDDAEALDQIRAFVGHGHEVHRDLVQQIAWEMHRLGREQGREIEDDALRRLLHDAGQPKEVAENFLRLTRLRGTILEERLGLFLFIHLAFQEYMVARYLAEVVRGEGGVDAIVRLICEEELVLDSWWREPILLVAGYLSMTVPRQARSFLLKLAVADPTIKKSPDVQTAAAELAASASLEWFADDHDFRNAIAQQVAPDLTTAADPKRRAAAGVALGRIGDPRPGVGLKDGMPDILWIDPIHTGPFAMGDSDSWEGGRRFECTLIGEPYRISRYLITVAQYRAFVIAGGYKQQAYWTDAGWAWRNVNQIEGPKEYDAVFQTLNHPQVGVSWYEAFAFCQWLTTVGETVVRLPTESEWERAARHTDGRRYPWGNEFDATKCNMSDTGIRSTSAVGIFPEGNANCTAADMSGNVFEWCSTVWIGDYENYATLVSDNPAAAGHRVVRGGSFVYGADGVRCACRSFNVPVNRNLSIGFRVLSPGL